MAMMTKITSQNNKAQLLLLNFSPEEVVKDAQQNPTLLHTLESFASDYKHHASSVTMDLLKC
eukprot:7367474-Ditylum_brightwellii.AAC.1